MKAIFLKKFGASQEAFEIMETELPVPGPTELIIKVESFGLNFADVMARKGLYKQTPNLPTILGFDIAGIVHAVGREVKDLSIGQKVAAMTRFGGYAEYAKTSANAVIPIPEGMNFNTASALTTQGAAAYYCTSYIARLREGDHILVHAAAGGLGNLIVQIAKRKGCIIFGTASSSKLEMLKENGVDYPIDYRKVDFENEIRKILPNRGLDIVYDNIGGKSFGKGFRLLDTGGKIISYGVASRNSGKKPSKFGILKIIRGFGYYSPITLLRNSKSIIGVNLLRLGDHKPELIQYCLREFVKLVENETVIPRIDKVYKVQQIADAHDYLEARLSTGKIAVVWKN
ncbi:zinc-binding dehydrogenase [Bacteroidota bacterium]